ncbi:MAG: LolA family protein [Terriglobia bacterium]
MFKYLGLALCLGALALAGFRPAVLAARPSLSVEEVVREFESHYSNVRTLQADFTQTSYAWGRTRVESGSVTMARGGRMRWVYKEPEEKIFVSNGKQLLFYVPAEKQLTISSTHDAEDAQVPLEILLSHLRLSKVFSRVEFANQALETPSGDRVIRGYPRFLYKKDYRSALIEITPTFDIRRLVVFYPDNSTMQFAFSNIERNKPVDDSLFVFSPPPGTEIIHQ